MRSLMITVIGLMLLSGAGIARAQTFDFKGLVLGSASSVNALQEQQDLKCHAISFNSAPSGYECNGKTTMLGQDGSLRVHLSNEDHVVFIVVQIQVDVTKRAIIKDMIQPLVQKFGPPKLQRSPGHLEWHNELGQVVVFTSSILQAKLEYRGGRSAPIPKLNEKDKKDL